MEDPFGGCLEVALKNLFTLEKMHIFRFLNLLRFLMTSLTEMDVVNKRFDTVTVNIYNTHICVFVYIHIYDYIPTTISTLYFLIDSTVFTVSLTNSDITSATKSLKTLCRCGMTGCFLQLCLENASFFLKKVFKWQRNLGTLLCFNSLKP